MTAILGISAFYHDSAAALVVDGRIVAAAQEERFTRVKHDHRFPQNAIDYCLAEAGLEPAELDYVGFYDKPLLKFERLLETYSALTYYTGFRVNSGEYKLMGLAPYGRPKYVDLILEHLIDLKDDGSSRMDMSHFNYCQGLTMTSRRFHRLFGRGPRDPQGPLTELDMDVAASIQKVTEQVMMRCAAHVHEKTGMKNLCLAGGVALNCVGYDPMRHRWQRAARTYWIEREPPADPRQYFRQF
jgi:predicted NodU family carbamoyl transferase